MKKVLEDNALTLVATVLLLVAVAPVPVFAYYQLMNWVVLLAGAALAYRAFKQHKMVLVALFALVAIVFNPFSPFYFTPQVWQVADVIAAVILLGSVFAFRSKTN